MSYCSERIGRLFRCNGELPPQELAQTVAESILGSDRSRKLSRHCGKPITRLTGVEGINNLKPLVISKKLSQLVRRIFIKSRVSLPIGSVRINRASKEWLPAM